MQNVQNNPVHMDPDGSWWFYNETWDGRYGPYPTPEDANAKLQEYTAWLNSQVEQKQPATEQAPSELELSAAEYIRLRELKAEIAARHKKELAEVESQLDTVDSFLLGKLQELGVDSVKAGGATVYFQTEMRANIADKGAFMDFIRERGQPELLQTRVSSTVLREFMEANGGHTPPGVTANFERVIRVRKA
jgi:hypothetical protein